MTRKDLKELLREVIREEFAMLAPRALPLRSQETKCDRNRNEDQYASTKTNEAESGGYKSPEQIARELLTR